MPEGCFRALLPGGQACRFDVDMTPYRLIHLTEKAREAAGIATRHSQHEIMALRL